MEPSSRAVDARTSPIIHPTWRILAGMVIAQIPGAALGSLWAPIGDGFLDLWYGAAVSLPLGFLIGLIWQKRCASRVIAEYRWHILAYGLFSLAMPVIGFLAMDTLKSAGSAL